MLALFYRFGDIKREASVDIETNASGFNAAQDRELTEVGIVMLSWLFYSVLVLDEGAGDARRGR